MYALNLILNSQVYFRTGKMPRSPINGNSIENPTPKVVRMFLSSFIAAKTFILKSGREYTLLGQQGSKFTDNFCGGTSRSAGQFSLSTEARPLIT